MNEIVPRASDAVYIEKLNPLLDKLDMSGLTYKQRRFIFMYVGDAAASALAAGYCTNYKHKSHQRAALCRVVSSLMKNQQIQRNIQLIQAELESFGVLSTAEAKMIISDLARTSENERVRMEAAKLALQWEGKLSERLMIDQRYSHDQTLNIVIQSHEPDGPAEIEEYNRLQQALEDQTNTELISMGRKPAE